MTFSDAFFSWRVKGYLDIGCPHKEVHDILSSAAVVNGTEELSRWGGFKGKLVKDSFHLQ